MSSQTPGGAPSAKRRRLDTANATLRKPFRSPMINRQQNKSVSDTGAQSSPSINQTSAAGIITPQTPATPAPARTGTHAIAASPLASPSLAFTSSKPRAERPASLKSRLGLASSNRSLRTTSTSTSTSTKTKGGGFDGNGDGDGDDNNLLLLQQMRASQKLLASHIRSTQQQLDLVRQARRIEQASGRKRPGEGVDVELRELVGKWYVLFALLSPFYGCQEHRDKENGFQVFRKLL